MKGYSPKSNGFGLSEFLIGLFIGALIGSIAALVYSSNALKQQLVLQQEGALEEYDELAWAAYCSPLHDVAKSALSNYLNKVEDVYSVRPAKDRQYYYMNFKGHARLARLAHDGNDTNLENAHLALAFESLKKWSMEAKPETNYVFKSLQKIDERERSNSVNQPNQP